MTFSFDIFVCWSPAFLRSPKTPHKKKWKSGNPKCHGSTTVPWLPWLSCWGWTPLNRWRSGTSTGPSTFGLGEFCHRLPLWPGNIQFTYLDLPRLMFLPVGHKFFFFSGTKFTWQHVEFRSCIAILEDWNLGMYRSLHPKYRLFPYLPVTQTLPIRKTGSLKGSLAVRWSKVGKWGEPTCKVDAQITSHIHISAK